MQIFKASDVQVEAVLRQLAMRGATILQAKEGTHPSLPEDGSKNDKDKPKGRKYTKDVVFFLLVWTLPWILGSVTIKAHITKECGMHNTNWTLFFRPTMLDDSSFLHSHYLLTYARYHSAVSPKAYNASPITNNNSQIRNRLK